MVINEYLSMVIIGSLCCFQLNDDKGIKMVGVLENPPDDVYDNSKPCQYCGRPTGLRQSDVWSSYIGLF
jgi:hypothetical protein